MEDGFAKGNPDCKTAFAILKSGIPVAAQSK
jgi:hypothetical protein